MYKGLQGQIYRYLQAEPQARERRSKDRAIVNLLIRNYPLLKEIPKETLIKVVQDFNSFDRYWRLITGLHPELRGRDYNGDGFKSKEQLEQEYQIGRGYEGGANMKINV